MKDDFIELERRRYELKAEYLLQNMKLLSQDHGLSDIPEYHHDSFLQYYKYLNSIKQTDKVLELGIGTGRHSFSIVESGCQFYGLDISMNSLMVLNAKFPTIRSVNSRMSNVDFSDNFFDVIVSCGSLGYDNLTLTMKEIARLIKPGGKLIVIDSVNNNIVYRINRYLKYRRGQISKGVIHNLPNYQFLNSLSATFSDVKIDYYGTYLYIVEILKPLIGKKSATKIGRFFESRFPSDKQAFKFVLIACK
jgi:ubiquinone/menaquinone biosynthesis C-methylase UbiE